MVTISELSLEILLTILEYVNDLDEPLDSIKNCCLVNRTWYYAAIRYVFRYIIIQIHTNSIYTPDFIQFVSEKENLHKFIRQIKLEVEPILSYCPTSLQSSIETLIPKLTGLRSIVISSSTLNTVDPIDLDIFNQNFLINLGNLGTKPKIIFEHACSASNASALHLGVLRNIASLDVLLTDSRIAGYTLRHRPQRSVGLISLNSSQIGAQCIKRILDQNTCVKHAKIRLGDGYDDQEESEAQRCLPTLWSHLSHLHSLQFSGNMMISASEFNPTLLENLRSLSVTGAVLINRIVTYMTGFFPSLKEVRFSVRVVGLGTHIDREPRTNRYYTHDIGAVFEFFSSISLNHLVLCGFPAELVLHILENKNHNLILSEFYDLYLRHHNTKSEQSAEHISKTLDLLTHFSTEMGKDISTLGMSVEKYHLMTRAPVTGAVTNQLQHSSHEDLSLSQRETNGFSDSHVEAELNPRNVMYTGLDILEAICQLQNLQSVFLQVTKIDPRNYERTTTEDMVRVFAHIYSHKLGRPLIKILFSDSYYGERFLVRHASANRVYVNYLANKKSTQFSTWQLYPVRQLSDGSSRFYPRSWALDL